MSDYIIWHNPRCSKSRQTLALLQDQGIEPIIIEYLKTPPSKAEIKNALTVNIVLWLDGLTLSLTDPVSLY